ncbi:hypothetical protein ACQ86O_17710 [Serratia sp. L9]|uniref:phage tail tube protein n=1 Tax=Serratia sp. L9 TaxID=3423946 RepID=UPI003D66B28A
MNETYYYGQGKVYLARRLNDGSSLNWRWAGDVSELTISLVVDRKTKKQSYGGQLAVSEYHIIEQSGTVSAIWHEHSPENLSVILQGNVVAAEGGRWTEVLTNVVAGGRYSLRYPNIRRLVIDGLKVDVDYTVDTLFGTIEFLMTPVVQPVSVFYTYAGNVNTALYTKKPEQLALRYEGINLAENGIPVLVELYKLEFDPISAMALINNITSLAGLETNAVLMLDSARPADDELGRFGRVTNISQVEATLNTQTDIVYNTAAMSGEFIIIYPKPRN